MSKDPFGNILSKSGPLADANLYRFSSKELHEKSGLVYYLYRYYEPSLQRWVNRDPIGEIGGYNLYGFVFYDPVNIIDLWGWDPKNPYHGFDPKKLADLVEKDCSHGQKLDELQEQFRRSRDEATRKVNDPDWKGNKEAQRKHIEEMERRIKNIDKAREELNSCKRKCMRGLKNFFRRGGLPPILLLPPPEILFPRHEGPPLVS